MLVPFINRLLHWFVTGVGTTVLALLIQSGDMSGSFLLYGHVGKSVQFQDRGQS